MCLGMGGDYGTVRRGNGAQSDRSIGIRRFSMELSGRFEDGRRLMGKLPIYFGAE